MASASTNSSPDPLPPDPLPFNDHRAGIDGESPASAAQPFWGRLVRALFMLVIAAAAHVWLERAPEHRVAPTLAMAPGQPGINAVVEALGARPSAKTPGSPQRSDGVTVRTQLVPALAIEVESPARGARPLPSAAPQPVGTAGVFAADHRVPGAMSPAPQPEIERASETVAAEASAGVSQRTEDQAPEAAPDPAPLTAARRTLTELPGAMHVSAPVTRPNQAERVIHAAPIVEPDQKQQVSRVLQQYAAAYERLDVAAAKEVYPSVNDIALRRAFSQLEAQHVTFESCGITISGRDANARCQGQAAYRPRVGPRTLQRSSREWTFDLAKADDGWHIVRATVR